MSFESAILAGHDPIRPPARQPCVFQCDDDTDDDTDYTSVVDDDDLYEGMDAASVVSSAPTAAESTDAPPTVVEPKPKKKKKKKRSQWISSFGRRKNRFGAIGVGGVRDDGYRYGMEIKEGLQLKVHTLVNVYFNDPELVKYEAKCPNGERATTDHRNRDRSDNHASNLDWATAEEQIANRDVSEEAKASYRAKRSHGVVQAREWRGRVKQGRSYTGGTPDAWNDELTWMGTYQAAAHTGHAHSSILKWLGDGKAHRCEKTGKDWEYQRIKHAAEPGYEEETWVDLGKVKGLGDGLKGVSVSDMGRVRDGTGAPPSHGSKVGVYRTKRIDGKNYQVHELVGWAFCGARPSLAHTIDHIDPTKLDADGCLSNARSNLSDEWADKSTQATTSRNGSMAATRGKRVRVRVKATDVVTEYTDTHSAARALGVAPGQVSAVCLNTYTSTKFDAEYIEEQEHLVRVRTAVGPDGKVSLVTEVERWAEIDPADWEEGGKYFCVRGVAPVRTDASTHVPSARNKRKRSDADSGRRIPRSGAYSDTDDDADYDDDE